MEFKITTYERDAWLENMHTAITEAQFRWCWRVLYERLRQPLTTW